MPEHRTIRTGNACVPEQRTIDGRSIVSLRVARGSAGEAARRMRLAAPVTREPADPASLWIGPDHWLLMSDDQGTAAIIAKCRLQLEGMTYNAVDCTDALEVIQFDGESARDLLSGGCGLDFRANAFPEGACQRTRFAQIEATIIALGGSRFEIVFDKTYSSYLRSWIAGETAILQAAS